MTFAGMGPLEILVVLLVAFIVMGPDRMLTAARTIGKVTGELRRLADGLPQISLDEEPTERPDSAQARRAFFPNGRYRGTGQGRPKTPRTSRSLGRTGRSRFKRSARTPSDAPEDAQTKAEEDSA